MNDKNEEGDDTVQEASILDSRTEARVILVCDRLGFTFNEYIRKCVRKRLSKDERRLADARREGELKREHAGLATPQVWEDPTRMNSARTSRLATFHKSGEFPKKLEATGKWTLPNQYPSTLKEIFRGCETVEVNWAMRYLPDGVPRECYEWQATLWYGYGYWQGPKKTRPIHRVSLAMSDIIQKREKPTMEAVFQYLDAQLEQRLVAAHLCRNRCCTRPEHLRWATVQENAQDRVRHDQLDRLDTSRTSQRIPKRS